MTFKNGNNHGVKFSKDRQPRNPGRKKSRMKEIENSLKIDPDYEPISKEDMCKIYTYVLGATKSQIERLLRDPDLPFCIQCHLRAIISDVQNGSTKTFDAIFDRIWGRSLQPLEISGAQGVPLIPDTPMSRKDYEQLLKDLTCEDQQNTKTK